MGSNDSPEIPDRGGDIRHPRPPFRGSAVKIHHKTRHDKMQDSPCLQSTAECCKDSPEDKARQDTRLSLSTEYSRVLSIFTTRQDKTRHNTLLVYRVQQSAVNSHHKTRQDKTQDPVCPQSTAECCQYSL